MNWEGMAIIIEETLEECAVSKNLQLNSERDVNDYIRLMECV